VSRTFLALPALCCLASCAEAPAYDLLLQGGTVIDGTGAPARVADVAIRGDRIVAIAPVLPRRGARRVRNVAGLVVAPGFWDNHAHLVTLSEHPLAENLVRQGITTVLAPQHSQDQPFPLDAYRDSVRMAPNVGLFAGHTWTRRRVMGLANRAPTAAELAWMEALVDSSMRQGALGLATGLEYVPAVYASVDEVAALAAVAARHGGIYVSHMRDEGAAVMASLRETLEVGRRARIPVQVNHLKITGAAQWGQSRRLLALLDSARDAGQEVAFDIYPYTAYSSYSDLMFPAWALADGDSAFRRRVADPATRARLVREMLARFPQQTGAAPASIQFRDVSTVVDGQPTPDRSLTGRTLADYLTARGRPPTIAAGVEALIELQLAGGFIGIFHGMDEADVVTFLQHPATMIETDGDLVQPGVGHPHPRSYGAFPRVLARYVREQGVLSLEDAIARMTSLPARWLGIAGRGTLAAGAAADVVVFDAATIADRSTYLEPHQYAEGVRLVIVNGALVLEDGVMTGARPGRFLERGRPGSAAAR
jgi:N-acyl-D-amino-acid deacylase